MRASVEINFADNAHSGLNGSAPAFHRVIGGITFVQEPQRPT
jgi:hypothetical protein